MPADDGRSGFVAATIRAAAAAVLATLIASTLFFALAYAVASVDKTYLGKRLLDAQAEGEWSRTIRPFLLRPRYAVAVWGNNECLILYMLAAPGYGSRWQEATSPLVPGAAAGGDPCTALIGFLEGNSIPEQFYHRYLHGYRVLTAALLALMPVAALPFSLLVAIHALTFTLVITALVRMRRAADAAEMRGGAGFLAIGISLLLFWGMAQFGTSISFAFGDNLVVAMVLTFLVRNPLRMSERAFLATCCAFGALDAWLEFLTGQTPLMLAIIPCCLAISCVRESDGVRLWPRICVGLVAFGGTLAGCLVAKWVVAAAAFGPHVVTEALIHLGEISVGQPPLLHNVLTPDWMQRLGLPTTYEPTVAVWLLWPLITATTVSPVIGQGSYVLGLALVVGSPIAAAIGLAAWYRRAATPIERARIGAVLLSVVLLLSWYAVFHTHFIQHSLFMVRPLVWFTCAAAVAWLQLWRIRLQA